MSRRASQAGIDAIRQAMKRNGWKQKEAAKEAGFSRSTLNQILGGQAVKVENLEELCHLFDLQIGQVMEAENLADLSNLDSLVQTIRDRIRPIIQERCGTMRVLDMSQPIGLGEIYTHVNILEKITGRTQRELAELVQDVSPENFERFSLGAVKETIPGLEAVEKHSKLMILGKPGAGKTTFLKHLAIQCIGGAFQSDRVPLFITLKDFAEADDQPDLMAFIDQAISAIATSLPSHNTQQILDDGRALILLDGLDEVRENDATRILRQIQQFSESYSCNAFVITCRIAAREYTFQQFTEVEVADFDDDQIADFANKWFRSRKESVRTEDFLQKLNEKLPIRKLATSPLLLSLLCLIFEDSGDFPAKRSTIYEQGIEQLLREWNPHERERCPFYKKLSPDYRQSLLRYIATETFEKGNYFFKQQEVGKLIKEYIERLGCFTPRELLKLDSQVTLKTIEAQHGLLIERFNGVYSFSHLTFHEYFIALEIAETLSSQSPRQLTTHITEKRWREVFLLVFELLNDADKLMLAMKLEIENSLAEDKQLQCFLQWIDKKTKDTNISDKPAAIRAFYLKPEVASIRNHNLAHAIDSKLIQKVKPVFYTDIICVFDNNCKIILIFGFYCNSFYSFDHPLNSDLQNSLEIMEKEIPSLYFTTPTLENIDQMRDAQLLWIEKLRNLTIRNPKKGYGYSWRFDKKQDAMLNQYYDANRLLVDCLNITCAVSREVKQEIEETLLLPIAEIEKRKNNIPTYGESENDDSRRPNQSS